MSRTAARGGETGTTWLGVDPIGCRAHGICRELLPELVELDEWGYPLVADGPVPPDLMAFARRAVAACPTLALRLRGHGRQAPDARPATAR